jgi:surface protein
MPRIASTSGRGLTRIGLKRVLVTLPVPMILNVSAGTGWSTNYLKIGKNADVEIDWGDGTVQSVNASSEDYFQITYHEYAVPGSYTVTINGFLPQFGGDSAIGIGTGLGQNFITEVVQWNNTTTDFSWAFEDEGLLTQIPVTLPSGVTTTRGMFRGCTSLIGTSIGQWDVGEVTDMHQMFYASVFNQPIGSWDVSNVTDMSGMFASSSFNQPIGSWDVSAVTNMAEMFLGAASFNQPLAFWDVSSVTGMDLMFRSASSFNQDLSNWCVSNFSFGPFMFVLDSGYNFDNPNWELNMPVWGTCPTYPTISSSTEAFKFNMDTGTLPNIPDLSPNAWTPPAANRGTTNISLVDGGPYTTGRYLFNNNAGNNAGISTLSGFQGGTPPAYAVYHNNNISSGSWTMECNVFMVANTNIINRMTIWASSVSRVAIQRPAGAGSDWELAVTFSSSTATNSGQGVNLVLPNFVADAWVHLVVTCELTGALGTYNVRCHVNGQPQGSVNFSVANFALYANFTQGAYVGTQSPFANGSVFYIDNVRLLSGTPFPVTRFPPPTTAFNQ